MIKQNNSAHNVLRRVNWTLARNTMANFDIHEKLDDASGAGDGTVAESDKYLI